MFNIHFWHFCSVVPSAAPELVEIILVNQSAIVARWRPPPVSQQHGQILGYQVWDTFHIEYVDFLLHNAVQSGCENEFLLYLLGKQCLFCLIFTI